MATVRLMLGQGLDEPVIWLEIAEFSRVRSVFWGEIFSWFAPSVEGETPFELGLIVDDSLGTPRVARYLYAGSQVEPFNALHELIVAAPVFGHFEGVNQGLGLAVLSEKHDELLLARTSPSPILDLHQAPREAVSFHSGRVITTRVRVEGRDELLVASQVGPPADERFEVIAARFGPAGWTLRTIEEVSGTVDSPEISRRQRFVPLDVEGDGREEALLIPGARAEAWRLYGLDASGQLGVLAVIPAPAGYTASAVYDMDEAWLVWTGSAGTFKGRLSVESQTLEEVTQIDPTAGDEVTLGDFDGDGLSDVAVLNAERTWVLKGIPTVSDQD